MTTLETIRAELMRYIGDEMIVTTAMDVIRRHTVRFDVTLNTDDYALEMEYSSNPIEITHEVYRLLTEKMMDTLTENGLIQFEDSSIPGCRHSLDASVIALVTDKSHDVEHAVRQLDDALKPPRYIQPPSYYTHDVDQCKHPKCRANTGNVSHCFCKRCDTKRKTL